MKTSSKTSYHIVAFSFIYELTVRLPCLY